MYSDQDVLTLKHHVSEGEDPVGGRRSSRLSKTMKERPEGGKGDHIYPSHSSERIRPRHGTRGESTSSGSTSGSMSDGEKEGAERRKRKKTRDSLPSKRCVSIHNPCACLYMYVHACACEWTLN